MGPQAPARRWGPRCVTVAKSEMRGKGVAGSVDGSCKIVCSDKMERFVRKEDVGIVTKVHVRRL